MTTKPASGQIRPAQIVHLLAERPELRGSFFVADVVEASVLWCA